LPLGLVVFSGGKSLHAWFAVAGEPQSKARKFFSYAVSMGCDPSMWQKSQMGRMPGATRVETGRVQRALYVDFATIKQAKREGL
jgi:hypothetical protein